MVRMVVVAPAVMIIIRIVVAPMSVGPIAGGDPGEHRDQKKNPDPFMFHDRLLCGALFSTLLLKQKTYQKTVRPPDAVRPRVEVLVSEGFFECDREVPEQSAPSSDDHFWCRRRP